MKKKVSKKKSVPSGAGRQNTAKAKTLTPQAKAKEDFESMRDIFFRDKEKVIEGRVAIQYAVGVNVSTGEDYAYFLVEGDLPRPSGVYALTEMASEGLEQLWTRFNNTNRRNAFFRDKLVKALGNEFLTIILKTTAHHNIESDEGETRPPFLEPLLGKGGFDYHGVQGRRPQEELFWEELRQAIERLGQQGKKPTLENVADAVGISSRALQNKCKLFCYDAEGKHFHKALQTLGIA